jgi:hypothetical protein
MRSPLLLVLAVTALSASDGARATDPWRKQAAMLPRYCQDRVDWTSPNSPWQRWHKFFGSAAIHMSHYCNGIYSEMMAKATSEKRERDRYVRVVAQEMAYVSAGCDPKCVIYADLHKRWAWALTQQGKFAESMQHTQLANAAPPTVIPASPPAGPK